jgi:hypothetical protein
MQPHNKLTPVEAKAIGKEAFLWGMHPIAIYHLRYNFAQNKKSPRCVGINRVSWDRKPMKALFIRWHWAGFRSYWRWKSRARGGRPAIKADLRALILRCAGRRGGSGTGRRWLCLQ